MRSDSRQQEVSAGPHERLAAWFRDLRLPLRRFIARRRGVLAADLDDVAQEVFLRLLRYDREELVTDPRGYLFKVAANVASEWSMRARQRLPHAASWLDDLTDEVDLTDDLERARRDAELNAALNLLPSRSREVLRLHFGEGLTYEAIAKQLNVTHRIVKRDIMNAYARLRLALSGVSEQSSVNQI